MPDNLRRGLRLGYEPADSSRTAALCRACDGGGQTASTPSILIQKPTVIAFFFPVSDAEMEKNPDINEALSDFQLYASKAGPPLKEAGVDFEVVAARQFQVNNGSGSETFKTGKIGIGYYFVLPGKRPHVQYGVMTDDEILEAAAKYLQVRIPAGSTGKRPPAPR